MTVYPTQPIKPEYESASNVYPPPPSNIQTYPYSNSQPTTLSQPMIYSQPVVYIQLPLKVYMKQKVFSFGDKFTIKGERGEDIFTVEGDVFSCVKQLHVFDNTHREIAYVHEQCCTCMAEYVVDIIQQYSFRLEVECSCYIKFHIGGLEWKLTGEFMDHDYRVSDLNNRDIMHLTKHWFTWGDSYELYIMNTAHLLPCVCIALAVDAYLEKKRSG